MNVTNYSKEYEQLRLQAKEIFDPFTHTDVDERIKLATIICSHKETSYYDLYNCFIYHLVSAVWERKHPNDVNKRWSINKDEYNGSLCVCTYLDALKRADFDPTNEYKLDDCEKYDLRKQYNEEKVQEILLERKNKLVGEILNCNDIRIYALYHFRLNR